MSYVLKHLALPIGVLAIFISQNGYSFNKLKTYEARTFELSGGATYFETTSNFNNNGSKVNLLGSNKYTLLDTFLEARYVFKEHWSVRGQAYISNAESRNTDFNRVNSTLNGLAVGGDWMVYRGFMDIIPEFNVRYSLDPISNSQDSAINNEGVLEVLAMLKAQNNYSWFSYYAGGGYHFRSERSGTLPWYFGGGMQWKHSFLGLELNGFQSIVDDGDKGTAESRRNTLIQRVNAGSYRFYTVNPSHIQAQVNLDIGFSSGFILKSFVASSISGQSYANGMTIGLMVNLLFDTFSNSSPKSAPVVSKPVDSKPIEPTSKKDDAYQIQTQDGVDQKLFEREAEVAPPPKKVHKIPTEDDLQDQLDQAEMSIKLKAKKKKKKNR
ncbi:MAG: hypothetical protein JNL11_18025 [Bdellovibrionaceae bacterium]|nr:hypothetical protein [Pseudobdellovibrionaceae bacterium]